MCRAHFVTKSSVKHLHLLDKYGVRKGSAFDLVLIAALSMSSCSAKNMSFDIGSNGKNSVLFWNREKICLSSQERGQAIIAGHIAALTFICGEVSNSYRSWGNAPKWYDPEDSFRRLQYCGFRRINGITTLQRKRRGSILVFFLCVCVQNIEIQQKIHCPYQTVDSSGAPPGTRTLGPLIKSQLLYQLS